MAFNPNMGTRPKPARDSIRPSCIPIFVPFLLIVILYVTASTFLSLQVATLPLQLYCERAGLDSKCNADDPQQQAASLGVIFGLSHLVLALVIGTISTHTLRFGRKISVMISLPSIACIAVAWPLVLHLKIENFEPYLLTGLFLGSLTGGLVLIYISAFAIVSDLSISYHPSTRTRLFTLVEAVAALTSVGTTQLGGWLLKKYDPMVLCSLTCIVIGTTFIITVLFLDETIDPKLQQARPKWYHGNSFSAIAFVYQFPCTRHLLESDAKYIYFTQMERYMHQEDLLPTKNDVLDTMWDDHSSVHAPSTAMSSVSRRSSNHASKSVLDFDQQSAPLLLFDAASSTIQINQQNQDHLEHLIPPANVRGRDTSPMDRPRLEKPMYMPPGNTLCLAAILLSVYMFVLSFFISISYLYMKNKWTIDVDNYSNMLSGQDLARGIGALVLLPLIYRATRTRIGEVRVVFASFLFLAASHVIMALASDRTVFLIAAIGSGACSALIAGFLRGIMVSEVSSIHSQIVMSGIAVIDVLSLAGGQIVSSAVYKASQESIPHLIFYLSTGIIGVTSFILPFLFKDSKDIMNKRLFAEITYDTQRIDRLRRDGFFSHIEDLHQFDDELLPDHQVLTHQVNSTYHMDMDYDDNSSVVLAL